MTSGCSSAMERDSVMSSLTPSPTSTLSPRSRISPRGAANGTVLTSFVTTCWTAALASSTCRYQSRMSISANNVTPTIPTIRRRMFGRGSTPSSGRSLSPTVFFGRIRGVRGGRCAFVRTLFGRGLTFFVRRRIPPRADFLFRAPATSAVVRRLASLRRLLTMPSSPCRPHRVVLIGIWPLFLPCGRQIQR
jgi:hypothetical protein